MEFRNLLLGGIAGAMLLSVQGLEIIKDVKDFAPDIKFTITSNLRSPESQAIAMAKIIDSGKDITKLYRYKNTPMLVKIYKTEGVLALQREIERLMRNGISISNHLCGNALDIIPYQNTLTMRQLYDKVKGLKGYTVIYEGNHIHLQKGKC